MVFDSNLLIVKISLIIIPSITDLISSIAFNSFSSFIVEGNPPDLKKLSSVPMGTFLTKYCSIIKFLDLR